MFAACAATALFACSGVDSDLLAPQSSGSTATDSGSSSDARTGSRDGGKSGGDSGIVKNDSGTIHPGVVPTICGSSLTCNTTDPTCCGLQGDGITTTTSYSCTADQSECAGMASGVAVQCRDNSDCTGSKPVCCGVLKDVSASGGYSTVECASSCPEKDTGGNLTTNVIFCSNNDVCSADGFTCVASNILPGFNVCGND